MAALEDFLFAIGGSSFSSELEEEEDDEEEEEEEEDSSSLSVSLIDDLEEGLYELPELPEEFLLMELHIPGYYCGLGFYIPEFIQARLRSPTKLLKGKTPEEAYSGVKPNFTHLKTFGCICFYTFSLTDWLIPSGSQLKGPDYVLDT